MFDATHVRTSPMKLTQDDGTLLGWFRLCRVLGRLRGDENRENSVPQLIVFS